MIAKDLKSLKEVLLDISVYAPANMVAWRVASCGKVKFEKRQHPQLFIGDGHS
jgi:hypothetical protein